MRLYSCGRIDIILIALLIWTTGGCGRSYEQSISHLKELTGLQFPDDTLVVHYEPPPEPGVFETWIVFSKLTIDFDKQKISVKENYNLSKEIGVERVEAYLKRTIGNPAAQYTNIRRWSTDQAKCRVLSVPTDQGHYLLFEIVQ